MKAKPLTLILALILFCPTITSAYTPDYMTVLWQNNTKEVMSGLDVGDMEGDGSLEIIVSSSSAGIVYAFGPTGNIVWRYGVPGYVNFVKAVDLDNDGRTEVLTGTSSHLYVINSSGKLLWKTYTENNNVEMADAIDVNGDGLKDILFNANSEKCGSNMLYAVDSKTRKTVWVYKSGLYYPYILAQMNVNDKPAILVGTLIAPRGAGGCLPVTNKKSKLVALNTKGEVLWIFNTTGGVLDLATGDIDGDGLMEIAVASNPYVYVLDENGRLEWQEEIEDRVDGIALAKLKDGRMQVLVASYRAYLLDPAGEERVTLGTEDRAYSVAAGDINNDGTPEYIIGSDRVYIYDYDKNLLWNSSRLVYVGYLYVGNTDNLPDIEVVAGAGKQVLVLKTGVRAKIQEADAYYGRAQQLYSSGKYVDALNYAMQAKDLYSQFQQDDAYRKTRSLMDLINTQINSSYVISEEAVVYYDRALLFYGSGDFINASVNAQIARAKYRTAGNVNGTIASEEILNKSRSFLQTNASVMSYLAHDSYVTGEYDLALEYARDARRIYHFLMNSTAVGEIDLLMENINAVRKPPISEKVEDFINRPEVRKYLYPSEYTAVNLTVWMIYLVLLGLLLIGLHYMLTRLLLLFNERRSRKTLDLDKLAPKDSVEKQAEEHFKTVTLFFLLILLIIILAFVYMIFFRG